MTYSTTDAANKIAGVLRLDETARKYILNHLEIAFAQGELAQIEKMKAKLETVNE